MASAQQGQCRHCDNSKDACASMMVITPSWWGQQHQLDNGNDAIMTRATTLLQQWKDARTAKRPAHEQWWHHCNKGDSKDTCALMTATTPLLRGQQCQLNDYTSLTTAEMPLWQGRPFPSWWWQRCLHINGNNTIVTRATMPSQLWQGCLLIDDDNNAIAMRVTNASLRTAIPPSWQGQQCCCGSRAAISLLWRQRLKLDNSKDICALTAATTPLSWGQQLQSQQRWRCLRIDGNVAITTRAMTPTWQWATRATTLAWQQQRCLHINNSNNTIVTRATIVITTTAKMPAHWRQGCHHNKGSNASLTTSDEGNNASLMTAGRPAHQQWQWLHHNNNKDACASTMATMPLLQEQQCQLDARWTTCVYFFLGRISFLSKTALSQPSQQGKEGEGNCTDSSMTPNNCVCHWTGWVEEASPPEGGSATLAILIWPQTLAFFLRCFHILCCVPQKIFFLVKN